MSQALRHIGLFFWFLLAQATGLISQSAVGEMPGVEPVQAYVYDDISGSPYLLDSFTKAKIYGVDMTVYEDQLINYNGRTQRLEIIKDHQTYELDPQKYLRAEVETGRVDETGRPEKIILQRGVHKRFENGFVRVVHRGRRIILADQFRAEVEDAPTIQMEERKDLARFRRNHEYYLKHHTDIHPVVLDEKSIAKLLGHKDEMRMFIRDAGLDLRKESDLSRLLKWYEDKGFVR